MTRPLRFWPLAMVILAPVLVLAVLAGTGLHSTRNSALLEAARLCDAGRVTAEWTELLSAAGRNSPEVILYDTLAKPGPVLPEETALLAAAAKQDAAELERLMRLEGDLKTSSGLPLQTLAGWHWLQVRLQQEAAAAAPDAKSAAALEADAGRLARLVTVFTPSLISGEIIKRLAERFPGPVADGWRREWQRSEARRRALQLPVWRNRLTGPRVAVLTDAPPEITGRPADRVADVAQGESVAVILPEANGRVKVLLEYELRQMVDRLLPRAADLLPHWAGVSVQFSPSGTGHTPLLTLGTRGGVAEVLSARQTAHAVIETGPREMDGAVREVQRLTKWAAAIMGCAMLTSALGFVLVRRALARERRLSELKSQFVSSVSHELRAPVGSLRLMAESLASGKITGPPADEFHRLMASEGARLSALIENVLDFARIEEGRKHYMMAETDVAALVRDAMHLMTPQAEARQQRILTEIQPLPWGPEVDAGAIQQAVINLLDNALKFSPDGTAVTVSLAPEPSRPAWSLAVTDHGPGIPAEEHARIFERFYRLGNELRRETTGTGIGLAIVKHIAEAHGGSVRVTSVPGGGSRFVMEFPAPAAMTALTLTNTDAHPAAGPDTETETGPGPAPVTAPSSSL